MIYQKGKKESFGRLAVNLGSKNPFHDFPGDIETGIACLLNHQDQPDQACTRDLLTP